MHVFTHGTLSYRIVEHKLKSQSPQLCLFGKAIDRFIMHTIRYLNEGKNRSEINHASG